MCHCFNVQAVDRTLRYLIWLILWQILLAWTTVSGTIPYNSPFQRTCVLKQNVRSMQEFCIHRSNLLVRTSFSNWINMSSFWITLSVVPSHTLVSPTISYQPNARDTTPWRYGDELIRAQWEARSVRQWASALNELEGALLHIFTEWANHVWEAECRPHV